MSLKTLNLTLALVLVLMLPMATIAAPKVKKLEMESSVKHECLITLSQADRLCNNLEGEGARSSIYDAYHQCSSNISSTKVSDLLWLKANGTPAGKLYAGFLLLQKDPAVGRDAFIEFLNDSRSLKYQSGCEILQATVSGIARNIIRTGRFLDFSDGIAYGVITNEPLYAQYFMTADTVSDSTPGESGTHSEYLVFSAAKQNLKEIRPDDLHRLMLKAKPGGKIYAAALSSLKHGDRSSFERLLQDKSKVRFLSGCKGVETTVGEMAKQLRDTGKFLSFSI